MKYLVGFLLSVLAGCFAFSHQIRAAFESSSVISGIGNAPEVRLSGINLLAEDRVQKLLPEAKSTLWWMLNRRAIETQFRSEALVSTASVSTCRFPETWGCFDISVSEKTPLLIAELEGEFWLLGSEGELLAPARSVGGWMNLRKDLALIKSSAEGERSPDALKSRLSYVSMAYTRMKPILSKPVEWLDLRANGEIKLKFKELPLIATFEFDPELNKKLEDQGARLNALLAEFGPRAKEISTVDLAYDRVAVVKFFGEIK